MIQHVLLWTYKPETTPEERARLEAQLASLPSHIPALRQLTWGPVVGGRNQSFSHGFIMQFDTMAALDEYASHPAHLSFAVPFREACTTQVVSDIEVQP
jgi:hypothetical protein